MPRRPRTSARPDFATLSDITPNLVDVVILLALAIGLANGYRRGLWLSLTQQLGLVCGLVIGAALAPAVPNALNIEGNTARQAAAVIVLVVAGSFGSTFGYWLGEPLRRAIINNGMAQRPEQVGGAILSGATVLLSGWFLGLTFAQGPSPDVARIIQQSALLRALDGFLPPPPPFMAGVAKVLSDAPFATFAGLEPGLSRPPPLPASTNTPGVQLATRSVYRVEGRGCGGVVTGSAYPIAPGYLITNAHVVAGTTATRLTQDSATPFNRGSSASVVLFDPNRDVAILYAPQIRAPALPPAQQAERGTQGAVIGYPGGGSEDVQSAAIDSLTDARGRDIFNNQLVNRQIWILQSTVRPGNSGGPLVDLNGHVVGLVFAASSTNPQQAYALTDAELAPDVHQGMTLTTPVNTAAFACAV
jgi:S1-C subfamily serine protease